MGGQGAGDEERRLSRGSGAEGRCAHGDGSLAEGAPTPRGAERATRSSAAGRWHPARGLHSSPSLPLALHSPHLPLHLREGASQKRMELRSKLPLFRAVGGMTSRPTTLPRTETLLRS